MEKAEIQREKIITSLNLLRSSANAVLEFPVLLMPYWNFRLAMCVIHFKTMHQEPCKKIEMDFVF